MLQNRSRVIMLPMVVFPVLMLMLVLMMIAIVHDAPRQWYDHD
jgi:hypothetical protein